MCLKNGTVLKLTIISTSWTDGRTPLSEDSRLKKFSK